MRQPTSRVPANLRASPVSKLRRSLTTAKASGRAQRGHAACRSRTASRLRGFGVPGRYSQPLAQGNHGRLGRRAPRLRSPALASNRGQRRGRERCCRDQRCRPDSARGISIHREGRVYEAGLRFYKERGGPEPHRIEAIVLISVEQAAPVTSPAYDDGTTERDVEQRFLELYGLVRTRRRA